ncbi:photosynthetic complex assembly protein PuhC [Cribrihabitans sp. XS_ASV171]
MSHAETHRRPHDKELVPRVMARALMVLVFSVLVLISLAVLTDRPVTSTPPGGEIVASRTMILSGDMAGAATVRAPDGTLIADLTPEQGGFVSGVWRVLVRERTKHRVALDAPVTVLRRDTGRLEIHDPSTGWRADLMGFGADNARAFAQLLAQ